MVSTYISLVLNCGDLKVNILLRECMDGRVHRYVSAAICYFV
jgi:hypothetical protein